LTEPVEFSIAFPVEFFGRFLIVSEQDGMFVMDSALVSVGRRIPASLGRLSLGFDIVAEARRGRGGVVDRILRTPIGHFYPDRRKKGKESATENGLAPASTRRYPPAGPQN
jgi:hypothetical protein